MQYKIYYKNLVFEKMIKEIPILIENAIKQVSDDIKKNAEQTAQGDTYKEYEFYSDPMVSSMDNIHVVENEIPIASDIIRNDSQNLDIELFEEMICHFYNAMVVMLWSYAECSLTAIKNEICKKTKKTRIDYLFEDIKKSLKRNDLGSVKDVWKNVVDFNDVRNKIVHEGKLKESNKIITSEYLQTNLQCIYSLLKKTADVCAKNENHHDTGKGKKRRKNKS